jgi:hypothetical protein
MLYQQPRHHRRIFKLDGSIKGKLDSLQRQVGFVGKVLGLGLFEIGVKGKSAQLRVAGLGIRDWRLPSFVKVFGVMAQDVTVQGWLLRSQRLPIFANLQPSLLRPFPILTDPFALLQQVLAERVVINRPT